MEESMREHFNADWAFAISESIKKTVEQLYPQEVRTWPIIGVFDFETYAIQYPYLIIVLRDKLSGISTGGKIEQINLTNSPGLPNRNNIQMWQQFIKEKFKLRAQDAAVLIPTESIGKTVEEDWLLPKEEDRDLWQQ